MYISIKNEKIDGNMPFLNINFQFWKAILLLLPFQIMLV